MTIKVTAFDVVQELPKGERVVIPIHHITSLGFRRRDHSNLALGMFAFAMFGLVGLFWMPPELAWAIAATGLLLAAVLAFMGTQELVVASPTATITTGKGAQALIDEIRDRWAMQAATSPVLVAAQ